MIKNPGFFEEWEMEFRRKQEPDFFHNLKIYEALYEEAQFLGVLPRKNLLEGIKNKIKLAKVLNV